MSAILKDEREIAEKALTYDVEHLVQSPEAVNTFNKLSLAQIGQWCEQNKFDEAEIGFLVKDMYFEAKEETLDELI